jgi:hypothetical protein
MKKFLFIILGISAFSSLAFADCQLGEQCNYFTDDIMLVPPYLGNYKCTLNPGSWDNVTVEVKLLTGNTISDPSPLFLSNDNKSDIMKVMRRSKAAPHEYLVNALRVTQISIAKCIGTDSNHCDVPSTIMCERIDLD